VWYIDPRTRRVRVYTSPDDVIELSEKDTLDGGDVLPGFSVPVAQLFDQLTLAAKPPKTPKANGGKKPKKRK
jgi:Uma2 family endonuclease